MRLSTWHVIVSKNVKNVKNKTTTKKENKLTEESGKRDQKQVDVEEFEVGDATIYLFCLSQECIYQLNSETVRSGEKTISYRVHNDDRDELSETVHADKLDHAERGYQSCSSLSVNVRIIKDS